VNDIELSIPVQIADIVAGVATLVGLDRGNDRVEILRVTQVPAVT
jgi:hypothetical protein